MIRRLAPSFASLVLTLAFLAASAAAYAAPSFAYRVVLDPPRPQAGSPFVMDLRVEGLTGAELADLALGPGLKLESSLVKPWFEPGKPAGSELRLEFAVLSTGPWTVESLVLVGREGRLVAAPMSWEAPALGTIQRQSWRWESPGTAYRYSSFAVRLIGSPQPSSPPAVLVPAPQGASLEPLPGEALAWVVTALEGGGVSLPEVRIEAGKASGNAPAQRIAVLPLPPEVAETRAVGEFDLSFEGPGPGSHRAGEVLSFRLALRGKGNLPTLRFPVVRATLDGKPLPPGLWQERRSDSIAPSSVGYEGTAVVEYLLQAPEAGNLHVEPSAYPVLLPNGRVETLRAEALDLHVLPQAAEGAAQDPFAALLPELALQLSKMAPSLAALPKLAKSGNQAAAVRLLAEAPPIISSSPEGRLFAAAIEWKVGSKGKSLALLYGLARRERANARVAATAAAVAAYVNAGKPFADALPQPQAFLFPCIVALFSGLSLAILAFLRGRRRNGRAGRAAPLLAAGSGLLLIAALSLGGLAVASSMERHRDYAVTWTDRLYSVPSPLSEGTEPLVRGTSAVVVGRAPGYVGLRLEDGSMGWAKEEWVFTY